jgi:WD40 repeat protein
MRRITIRRGGLGTKEPGVTDRFKRLIFDVRLPGAIAAALIALVMLSNPEPVQNLARPRFARGEDGAHISSFAFSPTGEQLATTNSAGRITLRAHKNGWLTERCLDFPGHAKSVAFSPDGRSLAAAGYAPGVCLWDLTSNQSEPTNSMPVPVGPATRVLFSPDGQSLAIAAALDGIIRLWNLATRRERMVLNHPSTVLNIAFSPDGRRLATGGRDDSLILLWDLKTGSRRILLDDGLGHQFGSQFPTALAFSPDGALLASASLHEHCVRLWDLNTRREFRVIARQARPVNSVAFSPNCDLLATASSDGAIGLWTVATGQRRASLDGQATSFRTVAFSPDGRTLVGVAMDDDDIRLWDLAELGAYKRDMQGTGPIGFTKRTELLILKGLRAGGLFADAKIVKIVY